jgi:hypothetical protein
MAVPVTQRNNPNFSSLGLIQAAVLGLTAAPYNTSSTLQFIPNMDGFPNGRRLEDDVTTIELQAVSGVVLAAIGLWYDDYTAGGPNPVTPNLLGVLGFNAGVTANDTTFKTCFPYLQNPWRGFNGASYSGTPVTVGIDGLGIDAPEAIMIGFPNPFMSTASFRYKINAQSKVRIEIYDLNGKLMTVMNEGKKDAGEYTVMWSSGNISSGSYLAKLIVNGKPIQTIKMMKSE